MIFASMRSFLSIERIHLRNDTLEVIVLPEVGAKILSLKSPHTGQEFLWQNPRIAPQPYPIEANFDNYWCGGWDDAFPTCETCSHNGEVYPNLGELRSVSWFVERHEPASLVRLSAAGPISPIRAEKEIRLTRASVEMTFTISHLGHTPIEFIWGTHPAYSIFPDSILHIPAREGLVGQSNDPVLGCPGQSYPWPHLQTAQGSTNMSRVFPAGTLMAGHYAAKLDDGWYAVESPERRSGVLFEFPLDVCPFLWLWLSYGGWRGYYVAILEPWTSCPVTLTEAVAANTHRTLSPGSTFSCTVRATPWSEPTTLQQLLQERTSK